MTTRITQVLAEEILQNQDPNLRISQVVIEQLVTVENNPARISQIVIEQIISMRVGGRADGLKGLSGQTYGMGSSSMIYTE